jgi:hypothetical protein
VLILEEARDQGVDGATRVDAELVLPPENDDGNIAVAQHRQLGGLSDHPELALAEGHLPAPLILNEPNVKFSASHRPASRRCRPLPNGSKGVAAPEACTHTQEIRHPKLPKTASPFTRWEPPGNPLDFLLDHSGKRGLNYKLPGLTFTKHRRFKNFLGCGWAARLFPRGH